MNININKFNGKSSDYALYRPSYSSALINHLISNLLKENELVVDVGCGTGILTEQLLSKNINVIGVEPNLEMYSQAIKKLEKYNCTLINASAENTTLMNDIVDLVVVAQALHWFDMNEFIIECCRILKHTGSLAIIYNNMDKGNELVDEYLKIHRALCSNYRGGFNKLNSIYDYIYGKDNYITNNFINNQIFTYEQYMGYTKSLSYSLNPSDSNYSEYIHWLQVLFEKYSIEGKLEIPMTSTLTYGKVKTVSRC